MQTTCPKCGHTWDHQGEMYSVQCPSCRHPFKPDVIPDLRGRRKGRTIPPIAMPEGLTINTVDGQDWLMREINRIHMTCELTPTDIKLLDEMRKNVETARKLVEERLKKSIDHELRGRVEELEKLRKV